MSFWSDLQSRFFKLTDSSKYLSAPEFWSMNLSYYAFSSYAIQEFVKHAYANPFVFMCVDKVADVCGQLDYRIVNELSGQEISDKEPMRLLMRPNKSESSDSFYYKVVSELLVTGNCFIEGIKPVGFSRYAELIAHLSQCVEIETKDGSQDGLITRYRIQNESGKLRYVEPENMLHIKMPNIVAQTHWGLSPLYAAMMVYESSNNIFEAEAWLHKNRGISGVLSNADANMPMLPREQEKLQQDMNMRMAGTSNFGKMFVTTANLKWLQVGMSPEDLKSLEGNLAKLRIICSIYGLDSSLFNDPDNKTYSNRTEAEKSMYTSVVMPILDKINRELSQFLIRENFSIQDALIKADYSSVSILQEPNYQLSEKVLKEVQAGVLTVEEGRKILYPEL